ncbi:MAG: FAD-dependent monooxygenase [Tardiphaga sp.]|uniref:FAD-dependent monooxygenase n=1 Tax=Tardiphaga sp. TaxID=1926292 RepID=UPI0019A8A6F6|nr:FAD-dependent monooxygenase [Tardiphaga sp.]MBC7586445.1 FAD-dependent monooxygenase [Tardiphaga sp.]
MSGSRRIVIAGAGIGGLTAALALAERGFSVCIHEKAERLQEVGAGLQLSPNASRVLIGLGLGPRLAAVATRPEAVSIMTARSGGEVSRLPFAASDTAPYWVMHRADLQAALLAAVQDHSQIELQLAHPFSGFSIADDGSVEIPGEAPGLALIGADGVRSQVRQLLFPAVQPTFSGQVAWRGSIENSRLPCAFPPRRVQLWMGPRAHLVAYPMSSGEQVNVVVIMPGRLDDADSSATKIADHFRASRWPAPALALIGAVAEWRRWPLSTLPDGGVWNAGPVALLGDAAHAMLPFAAQGAGMAIEDAAVLAQCLADALHQTAAVPATLARYAALRAPRVGRVQRTARQSGQIYHLQGPMALARDLAMRALGAPALQARQNWIYDWVP